MQSGNASLCPLPVNAAASVDFVNQVGFYWQSVFAYAQQFRYAWCVLDLIDGLNLDWRLGSLHLAEAVELDKAVLTRTLRHQFF